MAKRTSKDPVVTTDIQARLAALHLVDNHIWITAILMAVGVEAKEQGINRFGMSEAEAEEFGKSIIEGATLRLSKEVLNYGNPALAPESPVA